MSRAGLAFLLIAFTPGCREKEVLLQNAIPTGTSAIAGIEPATVTASPLYGKLPRTLTALIDPVRDASELWIVWNGSELLTLARGKFPSPSSGYTMIAPGIAAAGAEDRVRAAQAQLRSRTSGAPELTNAVPQAPLWAVIAGEGQLPLTGNLANLKNLLRDAELTIVSGRVQQNLDLTVNMRCATVERATHIEQSVRALATLGAAAAARQPDLVALLRSVKIARENMTVRIEASAPM
jgi:hypothetical protein